MKITPDEIIKIIKDKYNIDVSIKDRSGNRASLRSIYFYLCVKYCNPVLYGYKEIGASVNVKHPNVTRMAQECSDRIGLIGWEDFTILIKELDFIIGETYIETEDYLNTIELDSYDILMLKRRIKIQNINGKNLQSRYQTLSNKLKEVN